MWYEDKPISLEIHSCDLLKRASFVVDQSWLYNIFEFNVVFVDAFLQKFLWSGYIWVFWSRLSFRLGRDWH